MPAVPRSGLVVIQAEFVLCRLEAVLDGPAVTFDGDQRRDGRASGTPRREKRQGAIADVTTDQQAAGPNLVFVAAMALGGQIGEFHIPPVVQARSFGSAAGRQTPPVLRWTRCGNGLGRAADRLRLAPGADLMRARHPEHVAFSCLAQ